MATGYFMKTILHLELNYSFRHIGMEYWIEIRFLPKPFSKLKGATVFP